MDILFEMIVQLSRANIEVNIRHYRDRPSAGFNSGFYRSDGDAFIFEHKEKIILYTKFGGEVHIQTLYDIALESHNNWRLSKSLNPKWEHQSSSWIPLYKKFKFTTLEPGR